MSVNEAGLPRLIFCLTTGRSGTKYLASLLNCVPGVTARHEPKPDFADWARAARRDPAEGRLFLERDKLPHIAGLDCETYAETSHLFCKGFVGPMLDLGIVPDVIVLRRNARDVALSLWRRQSIPDRTPNGRVYLLHPEQARLPLVRWWNYTDYQLCYWYTLEMESRMLEHSQQITDAGGLVAGLPFETLISGDMSFWIQRVLNLPEPDFSKFDFKANAARVTNATPRAIAGTMPHGDLDEQEEQVREAIRKREKPLDDPRPRIDIVVLTTDHIQHELLLELVNVATLRNRYRLSIGCAFANPTSNNRNQIAKEFIDNERHSDWLCMIDEDQVPHGDWLRWAYSDYDVVSLVTPIWKPQDPRSAIVWNVQLDKNVKALSPTINNPDLEVYGPRIPKDKDIIPVASAGTGAILIRRKVLEHPEMRAPFLDTFNEFGIRTDGHDLVFCAKARELGFKVGAALQKRCSHYKQIDLLAVANLVGA